MFNNINLLALSLLSATALATPVSPEVGKGINDPNYKWSVTEWSAGCARAGCYYDFKISAPEYDDIPAFKAYCSGDDEGAAFKACRITDTGDENRGVAAHLLPAATGEGAHIEVSVQWADDDNTGAYHNYTGNAVSDYNQSVAPLRVFTITPSSAHSVAHGGA